MDHAFCSAMGIRAANCGKGNFARCLAVLSSLLVLNALADLVVDLGLAKDFAFLDISSDPSVDALLKKGVFTGDIGWSGSNGRSIDIKGTLDGDIYRTAGSFLSIKDTKFLGTDYPATDMSGFISDVDAVVAQFGSFSQDIDLGNVDQSVDLTIDRTDEYTVVDMSIFRLSSGTLTINGQADDIFYIRISDIFELSSVDIVVNGTDASRVFFIYDGTDDLKYDEGDVLGNIIAPNASVLLTKIDSFSGSVVSGDGFSIDGRNQNTVFNHAVAIPESTVLGLIGLFGVGAIFVCRIFRLKRLNSSA